MIDDVIEENRLAGYVTITPGEIKTLFEGERRKMLRNQIAWTESRRQAYRAQYLEDAE